MALASFRPHLVYHCNPSILSVDSSRKDGSTTRHAAGVTDSLDSKESIVNVFSILSLPEYTNFFRSDTPTQEHVIRAERVLRQAELRDAMDRIFRGDITVGEVLFALLKHAPTDHGRRHVASVIRVIESFHAQGDAVPYNIYFSAVESWWLYLIVPSKLLPSSCAHSHTLTVVPVEATGRRRKTSTVSTESTEILTPTLESTTKHISPSSRNGQQRLKDLVRASRDVQSLTLTT